jgi:hypothetical protein
MRHAPATQQATGNQWYQIEKRIKAALGINNETCELYKVAFADGPTGQREIRQRFRLVEISFCVSRRP